MRDAWVRARQRQGWLDHTVRAAVRYDQADGGRLAAAVTYYGFFAVFALCLLGFAVFGFLLDDAVIARAVSRYLADNLPRLDIQALRDARGTAGLVALLGLPLIGLFWVDSLRSSIRAIWRLEEYPGNYFVRQLIDLGVLAGLGVLLASSLAVAFAARAALGRVIVDAAGAGGGVSGVLLWATEFLIGLALNTLLAIAVLAALPRLRMPLRRVLGPALLIALGLELLKTIGRVYIGRAETNPAFHVVAGAVGLLVFLSLLNQLILFGAALTATSHAGRVVDLATRASRAGADEREVTSTVDTAVVTRDSDTRRTVATRVNGASPPLLGLHLTLCLPRDAAGVRLVRNILITALRDSGVTNECRDDILTGLVEACNNVVLHADAADNYEVTAAVEDSQCVISVMDTGAGFTPPDDPSTTPPRTAESGRGLFLISALSDQFRLVSSPGRGTTVQFSKRLEYAGRS